MSFWDQPITLHLRSKKKEVIFPGIKLNGMVMYKFLSNPMTTYLRKIVLKSRLLLTFEPVYSFGEQKFSLKMSTGKIHVFIEKL